MSIAQAVLFENMQLPETPPPPLAPLWDRILRARSLPPDLDIELLYIAIRDRLTHPEWEVRLHALRVLADLLPLSGNALSFPFDQVVDNLGHNSPNVRKAALDALKVFCTFCEDPDCAIRAILDKCSYQNIRPHSADVDMKVNVVTGLILSLPSVMSILKRRQTSLDTYQIFETLGSKLFDSIHRDVALRALLKLRRICGQRDYMASISKLDNKVQDKIRLLCESYDEDSLDVFYAPRKNVYRDNNHHHLVKINQVFSNNSLANPIRLSTDSSSEDSFGQFPLYTNNYRKVIIETEIKFDSDTAITMTVLEENETESEKNTASEEDYDSSDRNMLKFSDVEVEDPDVVVKRVRFGGESIKIRTPDSDNLLNSEDDSNHKPVIVEIQNHEKDNIEKISRPVTPVLVNKANEIKREAFEIDQQSQETLENYGLPIQLNKENLTESKSMDQLHIDSKALKKSGIPLPVINSKSKYLNVNGKNGKVKSKSLSELYDYFKTKNNIQDKRTDNYGFSLMLSEIQTNEKVLSPVQLHREVEVLHNLQRSPIVSPRRRQTKLHLEKDGFVLRLLASSPANDPDVISPRPPTPLQQHYDWEELGIVPKHVVDQLHNTENWIAAVKAADQLHSTLLKADTIHCVEPAAVSLVQHMWALADAVPSARAPAEGAVCSLVRSCSNDCVRRLLPALVSRLAWEPLPAALPHALLQRIALHHLVDLIFDPNILKTSSDPKSRRQSPLLAALCLSRAAGPAAVLAAARRRLGNTFEADDFCNRLRERLSRPIENIKPNSYSRQSHLPVSVRRRARSTPPPAPVPRRLRPLPDSAPLPSTINSRLDIFPKHLPSKTNSKGDSSTATLVDEKVPDDDLDKKSSAESIEAEILVLPVASPSIRIEDHSESSAESVRSARRQVRPLSISSVATADGSSVGSVSQQSLDATEARIPSTPKGASRSPSRRSVTPASENEPQVDLPAIRSERDVRSALAECIVPAKHEQWEAIVSGLVETARLAADEGARAPSNSWRAVARSAAVHVRSLRSRVARAACAALGALFEHRGRTLDAELEEAAAALLDRCADVNRFLRADAMDALSRLAAGGNGPRAVCALCRKGAYHRSGAARAAAAGALARLAVEGGAGRMLSLPNEPRLALLRAVGELLADATPDARKYARKLGLALAQDPRFRPMMKDSMQPGRYRAIEKLVEKLR